MSSKMAGRKIVFVYPPEIVKEHLLEILSDREYEVYTLKDHHNIDAVLLKYPGTIFYLNIDAVLDDQEWQKLISRLIESYPGLQLGVLSQKITDQKTVGHYLMNLGVSCGFIQLKQGLQAASEMMIKLLEASEARGRRKYLRFKCSSEDQAVFNLKLNGALSGGSVQDISSVGMSCIFDHPADLVKNQVVDDIQLKLKSIIVNTSGVVLGNRQQENQVIYVILFKSSDLSRNKTKIRNYIHSAHQKKFDQEFR